MKETTEKEEAVRHFLSSKLSSHGDRLYNQHIGRYQNRCAMAKRDDNERLINENTALIRLWHGIKRKGFKRSDLSPGEVMEADDAVQDEFEEEYIELMEELGWA